MQRLGHYGVALLTFAPICFALLSAGLASLALVTGAVMLCFAMLPDVDLRIPGVSHRGVTHTLAFALCVGAVLGGVGYLVAPETPLGGALSARAGFAAFGLFLGVGTVGAHLLADVLTPMGVAPFWPVVRRRYSLRLWGAANTLANWGLFALGLLATAVAIALAARL